jgi:hypothetical protein
MEIKLSLTNIIITILLGILCFQIYNNILKNIYLEGLSYNKKYTNITLPYMIDKPITLPNQIKPFGVVGDSNTYNNNYDVQPGLYDNQPLKKVPVKIPIEETIKNTLENNADNTKIADIFDDLIDTGYKTITKTPTNISENNIPGYKGYTLEINNWNSYKDDNYINGGVYENLIGVNTNKENSYRVVDGYDDFEIKEFK